MAKASFLAFVHLFSFIRDVFLSQLYGKTGAGVTGLAVGLGVTTVGLGAGVTTFGVVGGTVGLVTTGLVTTGVLVGLATVLAGTDLVSRFRFEGTVGLVLTATGLALSQS